jgi:hypothetical protein
LTAIAATRRLIHETALGEKLLLPNAERELRAAISASEDLVFQSNGPPRD